MTKLTDIKGVSESRADNLREEGFTTVDDVANATESELTEVSGVGDATAPDLIQAARDVIRGTVDDPDEEEETNTRAADETEEEEDDEEFPDIDSSEEDEPEVTEEDLEELNAEEPEGEPEGEPSVEDDEGEPEEVDVGPEKFDVTVSFETAKEYDYTMYALLDMRTGRLNVRHEQEQIAERLLDEVRPLGGAGEVTLTTTESEINALHALLTQTATAYQGESAVGAHESVRSVKRQVQNAREEHVL